MEDFSKIMEDAKQISDMMGNFSSSQFNENSNPMLSSISNIMNLMDILKSFQNIGKPSAMPEPAFVPENNSLPKNIKALQAIAPHMDSENKKNILIAAKLMELIHFMEAPENQIPTENISSPAGSRNMLLAARPYIDRDKQDMADLLISVMDISEILKKMERMNNINAAKFR